MSGLISQEDLARVTGYTRPADIRRCLERQGIAVYTGRGGTVWTTLAEIERKRSEPRPESIKIEFL